MHNRVQHSISNRLELDLQLEIVTLYRWFSDNRFCSKQNFQEIEGNRRTHTISLREREREQVKERRKWIEKHALIHGWNFM